MANRTGIPKIDAAIEAFLDQVIEGSVDSCHHGDRIAARDLAYNPDAGPGTQPSTGWCGAATRIFAHFLGHAGISSHTTDDDICGHVPMHGYHDMPYGPLDEYGDPVNQELAPSHCANVAFWEGYAFMIDWTAPQYGYEQSPYVRRIDGESARQLVVMGNEIDHSKWQSQWDAV